MRTNIDINDALIAQAMQLTGLRTKREVVERGLQQLIQTAQRPSLRSMFGRGDIADDYDYAKLRAQPNDLTQLADDFQARRLAPANYAVHSPSRVFGALGGSVASVASIASIASIASVASGEPNAIDAPKLAPQPAAPVPNARRKRAPA